LGTVAEPPKPNPFGGAYKGAWTAPSTGDSGSATFDIASDGTLTGQVHDNNANSFETITGTVSMAGVLSATLASVTTNSTLAGTVTLSAAVHLVGTLTETGANGNTKMDIDLSPP